MDKKAVRNDLDHIDQEDHTDKQKRLPERLMILCTVKDISYPEHMLQEDDALITESVVQEIDHVSRGCLKQEFPHVELIFQDPLHREAPPSAGMPRAFPTSLSEMAR